MKIHTMNPSKTAIRAITRISVEVELMLGPWVPLVCTATKCSAIDMEPITIAVELNKPRVCTSLGVSRGLAGAAIRESSEEATCKIFT